MIDAVIQYIVVFIIIGAAAGWIIYRNFTKKGKAKRNSCYGCSMADACISKKNEDIRKKK